MGAGIQIPVPNLLRKFLRNRNRSAVFLIHHSLVEQGEGILREAVKNGVSRIPLVFSDSLGHLIGTQAQVGGQQVNGAFGRFPARAGELSNDIQKQIF